MKRHFIDEQPNIKRISKVISKDNYIIIIRQGEANENSKNKKTKTT